MSIDLTRADFARFVPDHIFRTVSPYNCRLCVDMLSHAHVKITDREYWAQRKGQASLNAENQTKKANGQKITQTVFKTQNEFLREAIRSVLKDSININEFKSKPFEQYRISVQESHGRISYLAPDKSKPTRGRILGTDFEEEHIIEVLAENNVKRTTITIKSKIKQSISIGI